MTIFNLGLKMKYVRSLIVNNICVFGCLWGVIDCHLQTLPACNIIHHVLWQILYIQPVKYLLCLLSFLYLQRTTPLFLLCFNTDTLCDTDSEICNVSKKGYSPLTEGWMIMTVHRLIKFFSFRKTSHCFVPISTVSAANDSLKMF